MLRKLAILIPALALVAGATYRFVLNGPVEPAAKLRVDGGVYVLPKEFLVNLDEGRFAKLTISLVLEHHEPRSPVRHRVLGVCSDVERR